MRRVSILGSTGSIGVSTLDLVRHARDDFAVAALVGGQRVGTLIEQAREFRPEIAVIADETKYRELKDGLAGTGIEVAAGRAAVLDAAAAPADWIMAAIVGYAGLEPTLKAAGQGTTVALANKECLVCAGDLMLKAVEAAGATLLPVDSEHNAIFQVFDFKDREHVRRIILTASGGPFRTASLEKMRMATRAEAIAHPNWDMGAKISVDSATMMNKGLELIEAHHLFGLPENEIDILVHPQSIIHSMVEYRDGSVLAQMGAPDMRVPIAHTLAWPKRMTSPAQRLDFTALNGLTFEVPDETRFPALRLARAALRRNGTAPAILNAANEVAVAAFLEGRIGFLDIAAIVEEALETVDAAALEDLDQLRSVDAETRLVAEGLTARTEVTRCSA